MSDSIPTPSVSHRSFQKEVILFSGNVKLLEIRFDSFRDRTADARSIKLGPLLLSSFTAPGRRSAEAAERPTFSEGPVAVTCGTRTHRGRRISSPPRCGRTFQNNDTGPGDGAHASAFVARLAHNIKMTMRAPRFLCLPMMMICLVQLSTTNAFPFEIVSRVSSAPFSTPSMIRLLTGSRRAPPFATTGCRGIETRRGRSSLSAGSPRDDEAQYVAVPCLPRIPATRSQHNQDAGETTQEAHSKNGSYWFKTVLPEGVCVGKCKSSLGKLTSTLEGMQLLHPDEYLWGQANFKSSNSRNSYYMGRAALRSSLESLIVDQLRCEPENSFLQRLRSAVRSNPFNKDSFGRPILPAGVMGSISHKNDYAVGLSSMRPNVSVSDEVSWLADCPVLDIDEASAADVVGNSNRQTRGIGIDLERMDDDRGSRIQRKVLTERELSNLGGLEVRLTLRLLRAHYVSLTLSTKSIGISKAQEVMLRFRYVFKTTYLHLLVISQISLPPHIAKSQRECLQSNAPDNLRVCKLQGGRDYTLHRWQGQG